MPLFKVIIPAYKRLEEIHTIEAESPEEALQAARYLEPQEFVEDFDFYQADNGNARITEVTEPPEEE